MSYKKCSLFKGIQAGEVENLMSLISHKKVSFQKDDLIVNSGSEVKGLYIVNKGSVRGEMIDFSAKIIKIEDIESPGMLAPAFLFGKNNKYPVDIIANTGVEMVFIHKESFLKILQTHSFALMNYLNIISSRAQFLTTKIKFLSFHTIKGKFANYLIGLQKNNESEILELPLSQSKMADLFGVTRPSLGRAIRELHNDSVIEAIGKSVKILDIKRLSEHMK